MKGQLHGSNAGFYPENRPVLARMLLVQGCLAELVMQAYHKQMGHRELDQSLRTFIESKSFDEEFGWSKKLSQHERDVVCKYISDRLGWIPARGAH